MIHILPVAHSIELLFLISRGYNQEFSCLQLLPAKDAFEIIAPMQDYLAYQSEPEKKGPSFKDHVIDFFQTLVVFAAIGTAIYWLVAQPHKVSGSSMFPNFKNGDYIITDKL